MGLIERSVQHDSCQLTMGLRVGQNLASSRDILGPHLHRQR